MYCQKKAVTTICKKLQLTKGIVKKLLKEQLDEYDFDAKSVGGK
jgi:hypothetical protein